MGCGNSKGPVIVQDAAPANHDVPQDNEKERNNNTRSVRPHKRQSASSIQGVRKRSTSSIQSVRSTRTIRSTRRQEPETLSDIASLSKTPDAISEQGSFYEVEDEVFEILDHTPLCPSEYIAIEDTFWDGKRELIPDFTSIDEMDDHAMRASHALNQNLSELMEYLILLATSETEKVRAICRWVAEHISYDVDEREKWSSQEPELVARTTKGGSIGFSNLVKRLCSLARIKCEVIHGTCKCINYYPGFPDDMVDLDSPLAHAWNKIQIQGSWYLCDVTLAAGSLEIVEGQVAYKKAWSEGWFIAEPDNFLSTHLPIRDGRISASDQLVATPMTDVLSWEAGLYETPMTCSLHVTAISHHKGVINTENNEAHIQFTCPHALEYSSILRHLESKTDIPEHVMMYSMKDVVHIHIRLPDQGTFLLKVFGQPLYADEAIKNAQSMPLLYYTIKASGLKKHEAYPAGGEIWGPNSAFLATGAKVLDYHGPILVSNNGKTSLKILLPTAGWCPTIHSFFHVDSNNKPLPKCVYGEKNGRMLTFHFVCPKTGEYRFDLFLKTNAELNQYDACASFQILCATPVAQNDLFPSHWSIWGPNQEAGNFGLKVLDPICSTLNAENGSCQIRVERGRPLALWHEMFSVADEETDSWPENVYAEMKGKETIYHIRIPTPGFYKLVINASEFGERDYKLVAVFLIKCRRGWRGPMYPEWKGTWGITKHYTWLRLFNPHQDHSTVPVVNGKTSLTFQVPGDVTLFHSIVYAPDPGMDLADACVAGKGKGTVTYLFALPQAGHYRFGLQEKSVGYIATFLLCCEKPVSDNESLEPYWTMYGTTSHFQEHSMKAIEPKDSLIIAPGGKCMIQHRMRKVVPLFYQLLSRGEQIFKAVYAELSGKDVTYYFELPEVGSFRFTCWTQYDNGKNVELFSYLLNATDVATKHEGFPAHNELWGVTALGRKHKISVMHAENSTIKAKEGLAKLVLKSLTDVKLFPEIVHSQLSAEEGRRMVFTEVDGQLRTISVAAHERGRCALRVWIKPNDSKERQLAANFLITSDDYLVGAISFPTINNFYDGCRLFEPRMEPLTSGMEYFFKLKIPHAQSVTLVSQTNTNWSYHLSRQGDDVFSGMVDLGDAKDIWVTAAFDKASPETAGRKTHMLKYTVQ